MTPLRAARKAKGWTLADLVDRLKSADCTIDSSNLSRIERGIQKPSTDLANAACKVFGRKQLSEIHVLYPERFAVEPASKLAASCACRK